MIYVTVYNARKIKTYCSDDIQYLVNIVTTTMSIGFDFQFISKDQVLRIEFMKPDDYVATWTNLEQSRHSWVIRKVLDQIDLDMANMESDDDATVDE